MKLYLQTETLAAHKTKNAMETKMIKPDYQFDDQDKTLPIWKVKHQNASDRAARFPFYKQTSYARATTRKDAIAKVCAHFCGHDKFSASPIKS